MVATKERVNLRVNRLAEDYCTRKSFGTKNIKIYTDDENIKVHGRSSSGFSGKGVPKPARQVFADVSNVRSSFSRKDTHNGSKPMVHGGAVNMGLNATSMKISIGTIKTTLTEDVGSYNLKGGALGRLSFGNKRAKGQSQTYAIANNGRIGIKKSLMQTRNSLPVFKQAEKLDTGIISVMENDKPSENIKGNNKVSGTRGRRRVTSDNNRINGQGHIYVNISRMAAKNIPMRTRNSLPEFKRPNKKDTSVDDKISENCKGNNKVSGHKVVSQISRSRNNLLRNHTTDSSISMTLKDKTNVDSRLPSRKFMRPIMKPSVVVPKILQRTAKPNIRSSQKKLSSVSTTALKEAETSTQCETVTSEVLKKIVQGELPSDANSTLSLESTVIVKRISNRRKSFTSILVTGSKELAKKTMQKELPKIDDESNQLEVSEYVDDIYQHYWVTEACSPCLTEYMNIQTDITPKMRGILINWLIEVNFKFDLMQETMYLTVILLDQYLSLVPIKKNEMQLVGLTTLLIASKYEDFWHPRIKDLISISADAYTRDQLLGMEKLILNKLKFRLNSPTLYVFMLRFLKAAQADTKLENLAFFLIELCLVEYEALKFKPSMLSASAIYVARRTLQIIPAWTPLLIGYTRYEESRIRDCAAVILRLHRAAKTGLLNVSYEKYLKPELCRVAAIKPLERI